MALPSPYGACALVKAGAIPVAEPMSGHTVARCGFGYTPFWYERPTTSPPSLMSVACEVL